MREVHTYGRVEAGQLKISYRQRLLESISGWPDCRVVVTVKKIYRSRSLQQNAYFHGVILPEIRNGLIDLGWNPSDVTVESVKEMLKDKFARRDVVNEDTGEIMKVIQPTSEMSTTEFNEFVESCRQFAAEYLSMDIPGPNEQLEIFK